jgi:hypothetical protein
VSVIISDRFADQLRETLAKLVEERKERLVRTTTERDAGYIQGLMAALDVVNETYRSINNR